MAFKRASGAKRRKRRRRWTGPDRSKPAPVTVRFVDPASLRPDRSAGEREREREAGASRHAPRRAARPAHPPR